MLSAHELGSSQHVPSLSLRTIAKGEVCIGKEINRSRDFTEDNNINQSWEKYSGELINSFMTGTKLQESEVAGHNYLQRRFSPERFIFSEKIDFCSVSHNGRRPVLTGGYNDIPEQKKWFEELELSMYYICSLVKEASGNDRIGEKMMFNTKRDPRHDFAELEKAMALKFAKETGVTVDESFSCRALVFDCMLFEENTLVSGLGTANIVTTITTRMFSYFRSGVSIPFYPCSSKTRDEYKAELLSESERMYDFTREALVIILRANPKLVCGNLKLSFTARRVPIYVSSLSLVKEEIVSAESIEMCNASVLTQRINSKSSRSKHSSIFFSAFSKEEDKKK